MSYQNSQVLADRSISLELRLALSNAALDFADAMVQQRAA